MNYFIEDISEIIRSGDMERLGRILFAAEAITEESLDVCGLTKALHEPDTWNKFLNELRDYGLDTDNNPQSIYDIYCHNDHMSTFHCDTIIWSKVAATVVGYTPDAEHAIPESLYDFICNSFAIDIDNAFPDLEDEIDGLVDEDEDSDTDDHDDADEDSPFDKILYFDYGDEI